MPWKSETTMEQKIAFIREWESGRYYFNSLCEAYGISRQCGYDLINDYQKNGFEVISDRSRRPKTSPGTSSDQVVDSVKKWRKKKGWGAKKIRVKVIAELGEDATPSVTTIHNILIREGLITARKRRRKVTPSNPIFDPQRCNEIWSADYKGSFLLGNRKRCHPLTICDSYSRYIFAQQGQYRETTKNVQQVLRRVFIEWGMPKYLHTDNGSAFASIQSPCGYGHLSYWLMDHDIIPVFSDPGRPDQNGRHERMHRDLKARCCKPAAHNLRSQNRRMNKFGREYNEERPHEHLEMEVPAQIHERSDRQWSDKVKPAEYDTDMVVKRVSRNGSIRWGAYEWVCITSCLTGRYIGLRKLGNRVWEVYYRTYRLGYFTEGDQVERGRYILLDSDQDMNGRRRNW